MSIPVRWNAIAACVLMTLCASSASAVSVLEATLGFGGYSTPGRWAPLWIRCAEAPRSSSIQVARLGSDGKEISVETFPSLGGTRLECPVLLSEGLAALKVRLIAGSRTLAELDIDRNAGFFPGHLVLSCGLSASTRRAVSAALLPGEPIIVVPTVLSNLPSNGLDYDGVSAIVIGATGGGGPDLLTAAQRNALRAWIAGGGSLVAAEGGEPVLESLGLDVGAGSDPHSFGFGRYCLLRTGGRSEETAWREALGLRPYGSVQMIGASAALRGAGTKLVEPASAPWIRRIIVASLFAWLAAIVAAFFFARKKLAPLALVTGIALVVVLAGGGVLSRSIARGVRFRILVLALSEAGTAFATFRAAAFEPTSPFTWLPSEMIGPISVDYAGEESGSFKNWNHLLGRSILSAAGSGQMTLSGLMTPDGWRRMDIPSMANAGPAEPPRIDSTRKLAYLEAGEGGGWWTKEEAGAWMRIGQAPAWLEAEAAWLLDLKQMRADAGILVGASPASLSGFSLQGAPPQGDLVWALPLPVGGKR